VEHLTELLQALSCSQQETVRSCIQDRVFSLADFPGTLNKRLHFKIRTSIFKMRWFEHAGLSFITPHTFRRLCFILRRKGRSRRLLMAGVTRYFRGKRCMCDHAALGHSGIAPACDQRVYTRFQRYGAASVALLAANWFTTRRTYVLPLAPSDLLPASLFSAEHTGMTTLHCGVQEPVTASDMLEENVLFFPAHFCG
jgi:hypothetical protein